MDTQALYDLSPLARLMLLGVVIALGPLAWIWLRHRDTHPVQRLGALAWITLFITFDLVLFGAFTRLTDSGLGCPDWPGCYGAASPLGAQLQISAAQEAMPTGPVTHGKAWIEMVHRYLATGVGVLILTMTVVAWRLRARGHAEVNPWWPSLTLLWVCVQGAFGALTVTMKLFPAIVTLHLVGGMVLLVLLCAQALRHAQSAGMQRVAVSAGLRGALWLGAAVLAVQIVLGGWVSTNYAVLACSEFPMCQRSWWPAMDFAQGFELWRPLGHTAAGDPVHFAALTAIHMTHRLFAFLAFAVLLGVALALRRHSSLKGPSHVLLALCALQLATGLSNVVLGWPLLAAVLHTGGAAAMAVTLTWALCASQTGVAAHAEAMPTQPPGLPSRWRQYYALTKPRVVQLIVFCALIGMVLAVPGWPDATQWGLIGMASLGIWLVAGAAAAFNCIVEKGIDARMKRTAWRPTAKGELKDAQTLLFSALLCAAGSWLLYAWVNPLTMWLTFATFVGYAVVYTVILKPLTPQNIVIGGASGAMPPVLGWAALRGDVGPEALILFLIIFLWTPPHFWALALYRVEDYRKSGLPMLPVTHGNAFTRLQILLYTLILFAACLLPFMIGMSSWLYLASAVVLSGGFCLYGWRLWRAYSDTLARATFRFSLWHLSLLFAALLLDHYLL